jgi:tight adherence protein B
MVGFAPALSVATAVLASLAAGLLAFTLPLVWERAKERRYRRLVAANLERLTSAPSVSRANGASGMLRAASRGEGWLPNGMRRWSHFRAIEDLLAQAALSWTVDSYVARGLIAATSSAVLAALLTRSTLATAAAFAMGALFPYLSLRRKRAKRMAAFEEHFPEALDLLARALKAGHPVATGLRMVADEFPDPLSTEFRLTFEGHRYGLAFDDSIRELSRRVPLVDVQIFSMAVLIQQEIGGNLSEILENLASIIRQRFSIRRELRTYTAQGRLSGYVLALLPLGLGAFLFVVNRESMLAFVNAPLGRMMITTAAIMQVIGFLWIRRITHIEL